MLTATAERQGRRSSDAEEAEYLRMEARRAAYKEFCRWTTKLKAELVEVESEIRTLAETEQQARIKAAKAERDLRHARRRFAKLREKLGVAEREYEAVQRRTKSPQIGLFNRWIAHNEQLIRNGAAPKGSAAWVQLELQVRQVKTLRSEAKRLSALPLTDAELAERIAKLKADAAKHWA